MPIDATTHIGPVVSLADYTRPELIVPQLRERDTAGAISELAQVLQRHGCVPDLLPFYQTALNQELLANSGTECGIAFPHARLGGVKQLQFALGRAREPIIWGVKGSWPVRIIFLLAVPATDAASYLHLLSSLARLGQQAEWLARLRAAENAQAMLALLDTIPLRREH
jgi:PTS system fructose-specific IIC component